MRKTLVLLTLYGAYASASLAWAAGVAAYIATQDGPGRFALAVDGQPAPWFVSSEDYPGVSRVARMLQTDVGRVVGAEPQLSTGDDKPAGKAVVIVGTLGRSELVDRLAASGMLDVRGFAGRWETFVIQTLENPLPGVEHALVIAGSDKRGTIFGMFDLAAAIGVSPWHWWADVPVRRQPSLYVLSGRHTRGEPKVKYRGIFINDEAPALAGWMQEKFGGHNHKFYAHVFELILRLQGNYLWPAMWGRAIYDDDPESPRLADELGVVIGTSHHEPMMRAHVEWQRYGQGPWNYEQNPAVLRRFWREGIERMGSFESVVTVGMRGDGDEPMSESANIALLERIIAEQRDIISDVTGGPAAETPQMWALYKEVQDYYDRGMRVPDDVMLLLCDDNWGNIRKLPKLGEPPRSGGYGIYYHFDYVGGPRNYKWLNTNPLPRVWEQMHLAYSHGADRLWIVNVGDIKPMETPIEFFLDYAWSPETWPAERLPEYLQHWAAEQFGEQHAATIADILAKYAKYNGRRKPEMLAPDTYSLVNYREAERVVAEYNKLAADAEQIGEALPPEYNDAYFQLVLFPVQACANLNELYVAAGMNKMYAGQGRAATNALADRVEELFARDAELTRQYNEELAGGRWRHMMDQTHIGYTYWQEPRRNRMPRVIRRELPNPAEMGVAVEGSDKWWPNADGDASLPEFSPWESAPSHHFEVFNRGQDPFDVSIECNAPWLHISDAQRRIESQRRFDVSIDWRAAPEGRQTTDIAVTGPENRRVVIQVVANNIRSDGAKPIRGFVEAHGYVAIEAEHFTRAVAPAPIRWQRLPDLGRTLSAVTPFPVTAPRQTPGGDGARLEYRIFLTEPGEIHVAAYASPTLDYASADGRRYGVSIDDAEPQIVNINADDSLQAWERNVGANINVSRTTHAVAAAGEHVLKYWMVDPGVVLQRLVVDRGAAPPSYLGPPESRLVDAPVP
jgi:hypothetical protein